MNIFKILVLAGAVALPISGAAFAADLDPTIPSDSDTSQLGMYLRADMGWSMLKAAGTHDNAFIGGAGVGYKVRDFNVSGKNPLEHSISAGLRFKF